MGAVRMSVIKTSQQSTSNPHRSSPSVNILWSETLRFHFKKGISGQNELLLNNNKE